MSSEAEAAAAALSTGGRIDNWLVEKAEAAGVPMREVRLELIWIIAGQLVKQQRVRSPPIAERARLLVAKNPDALFEQALGAYQTRAALLAQRKQG